MKKFLLFAALFATAVACDSYDDSAIWEEIAQQNRRQALETLCNQMNTNISSIQTLVSALDSDDRVSDVIKIMENGKDAGYMLIFAKAGSAALYHWTDVNEGYTPCVGIRKDSSGQYCWVLDGKWILDDISNKISVSVDKSILPQIKADGGYWYVTVDSGETWQQLQSCEEG